MMKEDIQKPHKFLIPSVKSMCTKLVSVDFAGKPHQVLGKICDFYCWLLFPVLFQTEALQQRLQHGVSLADDDQKISLQENFDCMDL